MDAFRKMIHPIIEEHKQLKEEYILVKEKIIDLNTKLRGGDQNYHICENCLQNGRYMITPKYKINCEICNQEMRS